MAEREYCIYKVSTFAVIPPPVVVVHSFSLLKRKIGTLRAVITRVALKNFTAIALNPFVISKTELWTTQWKHELVHIGQQRKDKLFWVKYMFHFFWNYVLSGFNSDFAYRHIPYEKEAYELQLERSKDKFRNFLRQCGIEVIE